jgi:hypothetical protein
MTNFEDVNFKVSMVPDHSDNVIFKSFMVADLPVVVRTFLDDNIAQIIVDHKLVAEYGFGGSGCTVIHDIDPRILIDIIAEIAHSGIEN